MTTNPTNESFGPFHVQSDLLKNAVQLGAERPQGNPVPSNSPDSNPGKLFGVLSANQARWLAMPLFAAIYYAAQQYPEFGPLTIIVLLVCLIVRMNRHHRELAAVPLALAALKLAFDMTPHLTHPANAFTQLSTDTRAALLAVPWLPLFLAMCVFYMPDKMTVTGKIMQVCAIVMLASGLLPGDGYLMIFGMIQYLLFVAFLIGLSVDYSTTANGHTHIGAMPGSR